MKYLLIIIIILILIARYKKGTKIGKYLNIIATIILVIFIASNIKNYIQLNNTKVNAPTVDTSNISVELNGHNKTSVPIGVGEYSFEKDNYSNGMYFCLNVIKNSNSPWCGAITAEIEFFDKQNNSIGKDVAKSVSLRMGMSNTLKFGFSTKDGKIVYNQNEIYKIALCNIYEEDDLHHFLKSNFINNKNQLQKCIDEKNYDMFYSKLEGIRKEYPREEFPDENAVLDDMENNVKGISKPATSIQSTTQQAPQSSDGYIDCWIYDIKTDDNLLSGDLGFGKGYNVICFFTTYDSNESKTENDFEGVFFTTEEKAKQANLGFGWYKVKLKRIGDKKIDVLGMDAYVFIHE